MFVILHVQQALMLENLQKTSTHHIGLQPNSRVSPTEMFYSRNKRVTVCSCVDDLTALQQVYHFGFPVCLFRLGRKWVRTASLNSTWPNSKSFSGNDWRERHERQLKLMVSIWNQITQINLYQFVCVCVVVFLSWMSVTNVVSQHRWCILA